MGKTISVLWLVGTVACSSALPTAPAPSPTPTTTQTTPQPPPTAEPVVPVPVPVPPTPIPPKTEVWYYDASITTGHWFGAPLFERSFIIELWPSREEVWFHHTRLPILYTDDTTLIARDAQAEVVIYWKTGLWTFKGLAGTHAGTFTPR